MSGRSPSRRALLRILDANLNRSQEGLRVCEEVVRFALNDARLSRSFKRLRHKITAALTAMPADYRQLLESRDSRLDVGQTACAFERKRSSLTDIFRSNVQRVKESLRSLEEFAKLLDMPSAVRFCEIRFDLYGVEKNAGLKLQALPDNQPKSVAGPLARRDGRRGSGRRRGARPAS